MSAILRGFAGAGLVACAALAGATAFAQGVQVLDSVDAFGRDSSTATANVREMGFRDPLPRLDSQALNVAGTALLACQRAAGQGLYCLDGSVLRYWPNTRVVAYGSPVPDLDLFDCRDPALRLDTKRPNPCTSMTVDLAGNLWLAGRKANSHSVLKVVRESTLNASGITCSAAAGAGPWYRLQTPPQDAPNIPAGPTQSVPVYCAREIAPGRPVLVDTNMIDGEIAADFLGKPAVLGLEERKTVVLFPDQTSSLLNPYLGTPAAPIEFASGKTGWNLVGNEQVLSAALLQYGDAAPKQNYVLITTTSGRVMAKKAAANGVGTGAAFPVFALNPGQCTGTGEQTYEIRVSSESQRVYVADKFCRRVLALNWITSPAPGATAFPGYCAPVDPSRPNDFCLLNARETEPNSQQKVDVTLSTATTSPDGLSVAPGIGIDLRDCGFNADGSPKSCPWVADGTDPNGFNAAEATGVRIEANGRSKMTVFQVRGIADCRYWTDGPGCVPGTVVGSYLNITPLLPIEVTSQFAAGVLPALLISPKYRGQERLVDGVPRRTIDLFFAIPEPGVQFRDTFRMSFDVGDLTDGAGNGCGGSTAARPDLDWNVIVTGSEQYTVVDGTDSGAGSTSNPTGLAFVETLVNDGCFNPDGVTSKRFSYYAYDLEVVPNGDGVYGRMVRSLFDDLLATQRKTACVPFDPYVPPPGGSVRPPLAAASCANLEQKWFGADDKLVKCLSGTTYPRQSEAVNNCNAFLSQLGQYESTLNLEPRLGQDPANRIGELKARVKVLRYVFGQHFVPSIPPNGFCSLTPTGTCTP